MVLSKFEFEGVYYMLHVIHNFIVICDVLTPPCDIMPGHAMDLVIGFHVYHILLYCCKMRFIDWAHHILMCGILVLIYSEDIGGLSTRYALFFTTGLPGMCDYIVLALERNKWVSNNCYRVSSKYINVWLRGPGCVIAAYETAKLAHTLDYREYWEQCVCYFFAWLVFWNGCYFAMKAVEAEAIRIERGANKC